MTEMTEMTEMTDGIVAGMTGRRPRAQPNIGLYHPGGAGAVTALPGGGHGKRMSG
jgi:hypothetical protein